MLSDEWLPRYRLLENFTAKWNGNGNGNGNGNAYDRGDYNSSFALRAVELKRDMYLTYQTMQGRDYYQTGWIFRLVSVLAIPMSFWCFCEANSHNFM